MAGSVGFVGLGNMGQPMALNLVKAGLSWWCVVFPYREWWSEAAAAYRRSRLAHLSGLRSALK